MSCHRVSRVSTAAVADQPTRHLRQPVVSRLEAGLRAGDADRDQVAAVLSEALAAGYLSMEEFDTRTDQVLTANRR